MIKPYIGKEPYIFISYAHKNSAEVSPIMERLVRDGYRIWYDEGIVPGSEWDDNIAEHIEGCSCMLAMMSKEYLASDNCKDELNYIRDLNKPRLLIHLAPIELPSGMRMRLGRIQAVFKYAYDSDDKFYSKLYEADLLEPCKCEISAPAEPARPIEDDSDMVVYEDDTVVDCDKSAVNVTIKPGTTEIGWYAFSECDKLESITLPPDLEEIGSSAFEDCKALKSINIPESVRSIGASCFDGCDKLGYIKDGIRYMDGWAVDTVGRSDEKTDTVILADDTVGIACDVFSKWDPVSIILPKNLKYISFLAFRDRPSLKEISIPEGVETLSDNAFCGCKSLSFVELPKSLKLIKTVAFSECLSLSEIHFSGTVEEWVKIEKEDGWYNGDTLSCIRCSDGDIDASGMVVYEDDTVVECNPSAVNVTIRPETKEIGAFAFSSCDQLETVTLPLGLKQIEYRCFDGCKKLSEIHFSGTKAEWEAIEKDKTWNSGSSISCIHCSDGDITI